MNLQTSIGISVVLAVGFNTVPGVTAEATPSVLSQNKREPFKELPSPNRQWNSSQTPDTLNQVNIFFPKTPNNNQGLGYVEPVTRTTDRIDVAEFAIEQLIAGPTSQEKQQGFQDPIEFQGESTCGQNFTIDISNDLALVQFCRTVPTGGIGDDVSIQNAVSQTLKQFSTVDEVVILNKNGNCFKDASGRNQCLKPVEGVVWRPVAGTQGSSGGVLENPNPQPWEVGINTISRNGDAINFDVNANGKYVRYSANCQTQVMSRISIGDVENSQITDTLAVDENYYQANRFQEQVLDFACSYN